MPRSAPHFKVHVSASRHTKTAAVFADDHLLAMWVRLGCLAVERFADRSGDVFIVHDRELGAITGKGRADIARKSLRYLADISPISAERQGDLWRITFPNFAKKQGFARKNGGRTESSATATATATALRDSGRPAAKREGGSKSSKKPKPPPSAEATKLAEFFVAQLREHVPRASIPTSLQSWAETFDLMLRGTRQVGPIPAGEIAAVIRWVVRDDFERANVQSAFKLRKRYAALLAKAKRPPAQDRGAQDREAARAVLRNSRKAAPVVPLPLGGSQCPSN